MQNLGYVAGLSPYPYLVLLNDSKSAKNKTTKVSTPEELLKKEGFYIWYSEISEFVLRKGIETLVTNMFGRVIVSNFLNIKTSSGKEYNFTLPVNKNGTYEQIRYWISVLCPPSAPPTHDIEMSSPYDAMTEREIFCRCRHNKARIQTNQA